MQRITQMPGRCPVSLRSALGLVALVAIWTPLAAKTFQVDSNEDLPDSSTSDGRCQAANGQCTLRAAVQQANAAADFDTIEVPAGSYLLDLLDGGGENSAATGDLDIRQPLALIGVVPDGSWDNVQIFSAGFQHGNDYERIFDVDVGDPTTPVSISNVLLAVGSSADTLGGGGILVREGNTLMLRNVTLYNNYAHTRGSAMAVYGFASIDHCRIFDNHVLDPISGASMMGTVYVGGHGELIGSDMGIDSSRADLGGAIAAVDDAIITLRRVSLFNNGASDSGGAIFLAGRAQLSAENITIVENFGNPELGHFDTILVRDDAQLQLRHASTRRLGIGTAGDGSARIELIDSLLFDEFNFGQACVGNVVSGGGNWLSVAADCSMALAADDHLVDALVGITTRLNLRPDDIGALSTGSVQHMLLVPSNVTALDQADAASCPTTDELGASRPLASAAGRPAGCDAGAIELPLGHMFANGMESTH